MSSMSIANYFPYRKMVLTGHEFNKSGQTAVVTVRPDQRTYGVCHACKTRFRYVHSEDTRMVRDLDMATMRVVLCCTHRKGYCPACQRIVTEDAEVCVPWARVTARLARYVHCLCGMMTVKAVATHTGLNWKTVKAIDKAFLAERHATPNYDGLHIMAVDEIAVKKGHRYMTVVLNYATGAVVWMGHERTKATLQAFYATLTSAQRAGVEAVVMDMWDGFIEATKEAVPHAAIVFDLFHVVAAFGRVIDRVRVSEYHKAAAAHRPVFKGAKYLLLANRSTLRRRRQRNQLKHLLALNRSLAILYILKEQLKHIWTYTSRTWAANALRVWIAMARRVRHPAVAAFCRMLKAHAYGILAHCDYAIHTSILEGVNNKIKVIKRTAYGYLDPDYFILKVKQAFSPPPAPAPVQLFGR